MAVGKGWFSFECVWRLGVCTFDGSWVIFSLARFGGPSRVESMCLWDPRLEITFSSSSSVLVGEDKVPTTFASEVGLFRDSSGRSLITSWFFCQGRVRLPCLNSSSPSDSVRGDKVPTTVASEAGLFSDSSRCWPITLGLFLGGLVGLPCLVFFPWRTTRASLFDYRRTTQASLFIYPNWCAAKIH